MRRHYCKMCTNSWSMELWSFSITKGALGYICCVDKQHWRNFQIKREIHRPQLCLLKVFKKDIFNVLSRWFLRCHPTIILAVFTSCCNSWSNRRSHVVCENINYNTTLYRSTVFLGAIVDNYRQGKLLTQYLIDQVRVYTSNSIWVPEFIYWGTISSWFLHRFLILLQPTSFAHALYIHTFLCLLARRFARG